MKNTIAILAFLAVLSLIAPAYAAEATTNKTTFGDLLYWASWGMIVFSVGAIIWSLRKSNLGKQKQVFEKHLAYMDRAETHMERTEKLLEEILQTLKQKH